MKVVSVPCGTCGKPVRTGDEFCEACGGAVSPEAKRALKSASEEEGWGLAMHNKKVRDAQGAIGGLSILFVLSGGLFFFLTRSKANEALSKFSTLSDSARLQTVVQGASTAGELRAVLEREPWQVLGLNLFLALVMLGLWMWSKRAVLPAVITALVIYVAVQVTNLIVDPASIVQGVLVKIVVIGALVRGVSSALAARKVELAR